MTSDMACGPSTLRDMQLAGTDRVSLKPSALPPREPGAECALCAGGAALAPVARRVRAGLLGALPTLFSTMLCGKLI